VADVTGTHLPGVVGLDAWERFAWRMLLRVEHEEQEAAMGRTPRPATPARRGAPRRR